LGPFSLYQISDDVVGCVKSTFMFEPMRYIRVCAHMWYTYPKNQWATDSTTSKFSGKRWICRRGFPNL